MREDAGRKARDESALVAALRGLDWRAGRLGTRGHDRATIGRGGTREKPIEQLRGDTTDENPIDKK